MTMLGGYWFFLLVAVPGAVLAWVGVRRGTAAGRWSRGGARAVLGALGLLVAGLIVLPVVGAVGAEIQNRGLHGAAAAVFTVGAIATLALLTWVLLGDRSRGRRRCPSVLVRHARDQRVDVPGVQEGRTAGEAALQDSTRQAGDRARAAAVARRPG